MTTTPKDKKDNAKDSREHHVETPNPPQVMDPSAKPEDQNRDQPENQKKETSTAAKSQNKDQNKKAGKGDPLTPNEEL